METFRSFTALHAATLAAIAALTALAVSVRRRRPAGAAPGPVERAVAFAYLAAWVTTYGFLLFPPLHDPPTTYPLQLCHLNALCAALALVFPRRPLRAITYFWGIALSTQALITPSLTEGPALYPYWFFWTSHGLIAGVALYEVLARGFRPTLRDYGMACAAAALYVAIVLPIDLVLGWNYGFVGPSKPDVPSIVDFLGPWPERLVPIGLIAAGAMALALAPWAAARRVGRGARLAAAGPKR